MVMETEFVGQQNVSEEETLAEEFEAVDDPDELLEGLESLED